MPELPEVEITCRLLRQDDLIGQTISKTVLRVAPSRLGNRRSFLYATRGATIIALHRRGKYIILTLDNARYLVIHLRMSGRLWVCVPTTPLTGYERVLFLLNDGRELRFYDPRKLGTMQITKDLTVVDNACGVEPLEKQFTVARLQNILATHARMIKALLLDQKIIAGLGNIYVDEALWYARIHPQQISNTIRNKTACALHQSIRVALMKGIRYGGTALGSGASNFSVPRATPSNSEYLRVYRRANLACFRCNTSIRKIKVAGRGTHICPKCQRERRLHAP